MHLASWILVPLACALCVGIAAHPLLGALERAVRAQRERHGAWGWRDVPELLLFLAPSDRLRASLLLGGAGAALGAGVLEGWGAPLLFAAAAWCAHAGLALHRRRWRESIERQLCEALPGLAGALRAGLSLPQALEQLGRDAPAPLGRELAVVVRRLKLGVPLDEALDELAARVGSEDLALVASATAITRQVGGNLAELYETLAATIRERFRLEGRIRALTAQGRLQGRIVGAMPLLLGAALLWLRPDLVEPMLRHPFGWALVGAVAALEAAGMALIRRIVSIRV